MTDHEHARNPRSYYSATLFDFQRTSTPEILGALLAGNPTVEGQQRDAWTAQIAILKEALYPFHDGYLHFEFKIPRVGRRADVVILISGIVFAIEFKVGANHFLRADLDQAEGYAVDLKNFHLASHNAPIVPILVATSAPDVKPVLCARTDLVYEPVKANGGNLGPIIAETVDAIDSDPLDPAYWSDAPYSPTPTIIEAATHLYANHDVTEIAQSGAAAENLAVTAASIQAIIDLSRASKRKSICFVTGVPGAGKTLVGLNIATADADGETEDLAVYLSGNGPLVTVLREALARDESERTGGRIGESRRRVERFIQNIHHFRDDALESLQPPAEHVAVFDEAQRAWDEPNTSKFMRQKKNQPDFNQSEPEFLIEYMDRHQDWCVIVALVGGGQEINSGEAGLPGWFDALATSFEEWDVYFSPQLHQIEFDGGKADFGLLAKGARNVEERPGLHLSTSMRSFRAERLSHMVHHVIANDSDGASRELEEFRSKFPLKITRDLELAKSWIVEKSRGFESFGLVASSGGLRLRPDGIFVKNDFDASNWFLSGRDDVRSSYFLETVATEFDIQGLELDWVLLAWDADLRHTGQRFEHFEFSGTKWNRRKAAEGKQFLENAYRVLLTRARQGMVIFVPNGNAGDRTRSPEFYEETYRYLLRCGFEEI